MSGGPAAQTTTGSVLDRADMPDIGPVCGLARDVFVPGLLPGLGGVAYELLRAHPESRLPDVLMLSPGPA